MADTEKVPEPITPPKSKGIPAAKMIKVSNRLNAPYELTLIHTSKMYRLAPRGQDGDTVELTEAQVDSEDFQSAIPYVIVTK